MGAFLMNNPLRLSYHNRGGVSHSSVLLYFLRVDFSDIKGNTSPNYYRHQK